MQSSTQLICLLHTGFTCMCRPIMDICVYFCLFVDSFVQICLTEDLIGLIMLTFKRMIHVGGFAPKNRKMYKRETKEPLYRWNPYFITITLFWYSKVLETTFRPEHFLNFNKINSKNSIYIGFLCEK